MTMRIVELPGLPGDIRVRKSTRRRRTVEARREGGITVVTVPERMSNAEAFKHAIALHQKITSKRSKQQRSDADLMTLAKRLRRVYLPEAPDPLSVRWVSNQNHRWGSCTPSEGSIRLSDRLQHMPAYVIESVLIHELSHLLVANHGPEFDRLLRRFPDHDKAVGFLDGIDFVRRNPEAAT